MTVPASNRKTIIPTAIITRILPPCVAARALTEVFMAGRRLGCIAFHPECRLSDQCLGAFHDAGDPHDLGHVGQCDGNGSTPRSRACGQRGSAGVRRRDGDGHGITMPEGRGVITCASTARRRPPPACGEPGANGPPVASVAETLTDTLLLWGGGAV